MLADQAVGAVDVGFATRNVFLQTHEDRLHALKYLNCV
jgi:hypothetical protein